MSYAPLASRALLIRYWEKQGRPASVTVVPGLPARTVRVQARGTDLVSAGGRDVRLRRFTVDGVVWGRETVWLDERDRFAAIVSRIHILPLEAVREDLKDSLPALQRVAIADAVQDLAAMSAQREGAIPAHLSMHVYAGALIEEAAWQSLQAAAEGVPRLELRRWSRDLRAELLLSGPSITSVLRGEWHGRE